MVNKFFKRKYYACTQLMMHLMRNLSKMNRCTAPSMKHCVATIAESIFANEMQDQKLMNICAMKVRNGENKI